MPVMSEPTSHRGLGRPIAGLSHPPAIFSFFADPFRRSIEMLLAGILVLSWVLLLPPAEVVHRVEWSRTFGTWTETSHPPKIQYCDQPYLPADRSFNSLAAALQSDKARFIQLGGLHVVAQTPAGTPIEGPSVPPASGRCSLVLFVLTGPGDWLEYDASLPALLHTA